MRLAAFNYKFLNHTVLYVEDLKDNSLPTLTNSIERVLELIEKKEKINWRNFLVIQKDSEDIYSLVYFSPNFPNLNWRFLSKTSLDDALNKLVD